jgi:hypothetical protein
MLPSQFVRLPIREKALLIAMIDERVKEEKQQAANARKGGRRR